MLEQIIHTENKLYGTSLSSGTRILVPCCEQGVPLLGTVEPGMCWVLWLIADQVAAALLLWRK